MKGKKSPDDNDIIFGMKEISNFIGRSIPSIVKYMRDYEDFPVKKDNGKGYVASKRLLIEWFREYVRRK
jgi:hypothetical protein